MHRYESQRLPLGLEAGDDLFGVHAELDDLEGDAAAHRFLLLSHIDHTTATLADLLKELHVALVRSRKIPVALEMGAYRSQAD